jgi:hypothetical protein
MSDRDDTPKYSSCFAERGAIWFLSVFLIILLSLMCSGIFFSRASNCSEGRKGISKSIFNCRQIILSMRLYAADHDGAYPDSAVPFATDSNTAFRQLIVSGSVEDEKIFGSGNSPFIPDGDIGEEPAFLRAVEPGENHWAMTRGLDEKSPPGIPLVYENPVEATWPPTWNADAAEKKIKGRSWKGGKVIIGTQDTSVELMKLESTKGAKVTTKPLPAKAAPGNLFTHYKLLDGSKYEVLDVAIK